jgi:dTMP kinase
MNAGSYGHLIVFEGPDGVGKTTISQASAQWLNAHGILTELHSFPGQQLGTVGRLIYGIHHDPVGMGIDAISPTAIQALHVAAHVDAIERLLLPALAAGANVVLDRYWWSTVAYGAVAGASREVINGLIAAEVAAWRGIKPTLAVILERDLGRHDRDPTSDELISVYEEIAHGVQSDYPVRHIPNNEQPSRTVKAVIDALHDIGAIRT